ncbi:MAG: hypothetical protein P4L71_05260 [Acetobacteraceae bacterium]|nr:hypothetical protein [Acetobacteraceae bacterium]
MLNTRRGTMSAFLLLLASTAIPGGAVLAQAVPKVTPPTAPWPHTNTIDGTTVVVYQPQAIAWPDHADLTARAAIAITHQGEKTPILGTIDVTFATVTDAATGMVALSDPRLTASHFPALDTNAAGQLEDRIKARLPRMPLQPVPLQAVLLSLKDKPPAQDVAVQNDPPAIFHSEKPASLVVFDGEPVLAPIASTGLSFAVNTNWDVFSDGHAWYLLDGGLWLKADAYNGPYAPIATLPAAFRSLPADPAFADARKAIPPKAGKAAVVPAVFVSTRPAEIIVTDGPLQFEPVKGTGLQVVKNTDSALFFHPASGQFYLLISGRWFAASGLDGAWHFASNDLPPDFAAIPPDGKLAAVLPSVPGTAQAELAVLQAQVPQQATLKKDAAKVTVVYAGEPQFQAIPGTALAYAVNTSYQVIQVGAAFYVCYQGAWFTGTAPNGPWVLATSVPAAIYTIPPSSPLYNVTYVKVYAATPTTVTYGYTAGYMLGFITAGLLVYGTGYYYPPVVFHGAMPIYYPRPYTYGGSVWYNPANGGWAQGGAVYGPYAGARGGSYYNPNTGAYARGGSVYGPYGGASGFSAYNPSTGSYARGSAAWNGSGGAANASYYNARTGTSGSTNQNWNAYSRWGSSTVSGPNQTVNTASGSNARGSVGGFSSSTGAQGAGYSTARGSGGAVKTQNGDVYAGRDGNVYQHGSDGWSKYNNGGWQPVTPPSGSAQNRSGGSTAQPAPQGARGNAGTQPRQQTPRQPIDSTSYNQLEQDRQARFSGGQGGGREGGWRSGGGGGGGGGRFRR